MKIINRQDITTDIYRLILDTETHHDQLIIEDENGTLRWQANPSVRKYIDTHGLNDVIRMLHGLGHNKNSEVYRKLYRDMGYSLYGYWEIFYWEVNNEDWEEYVPNQR